MTDLGIAASQANDLLENDILKRAFATVRQRAIDEAMTVPAWHGRIGDRRRRRALERASMVDELRREIAAVIDAAAVERAKARRGTA